ncbi:MAG: phage antirepressor [Sarcina sp.]
MSNELQVINEQEVLGKEFRVYGTVEKPLFLAKDVANWIEHSNLTMMLRNIDEDEKVLNNVYTLGGNQEMWFLTEDGLYEVLMQSRKPIAKAFKKQVKEILKSIRKNGAYMTDNALEQAIENPDFMIGLLQNLKKEKEEKKRLQEENDKLVVKIEEDAPKVTFADRVIKSGDNILVRELAKILSDEGFTIGERRLYTQLREWGYICKNSTESTQRAMNQKYFIVDVRTINTVYGIKETKTTKVTPKGQIRIVERTLKENGINN